MSTRRSRREPLTPYMNNPDGPRRRTRLPTIEEINEAILEMPAPMRRPRKVRSNKGTTRGPRLRVYKVRSNKGTQRKPCAEGTERRAGRCRTKCGPGRFRNPLTQRCVLQNIYTTQRGKCPPGFFSSLSGVCVRRPGPIRKIRRNKGIRRIPYGPRAPRTPTPLRQASAPRLTEFL
jgi:hypothetical protein